jgi:aminocarboxymuconate-semialdehyde decarboxylase
VDTHTHILPEKWPSLKDRYGYGGFVQMEHTGPGKARMFKDDGTPFRNVEDNCWSLERRIADSDACGVDVHVLSTVPVMFSYWAKPEDTLDLSMMLNDHMSRCVASNPKRFVGEERGAKGAPARAETGGRSSRASRSIPGQDGRVWIQLQPSVI